jgi:hypothetical protein
MLSTFDEIKGRPREGGEGRRNAAGNRPSFIIIQSFIPRALAVCAEKATAGQLSAY